MTTGFIGAGLSVQVAFSDDVWATSPAWTDITKYVASITTSMGRQHELQQVNPSTAVITLHNEALSHGDTTGGRFSPWNSGSAYYNSGNGLTPGHPVRIRQTISATTYNVFYGYTQSWVPVYGQSTSTVTLNCYDAMALLNLSYMDTSSYPTQIIADGATAYWECQDQGPTSILTDSTGGGHAATLDGYFSFGNVGALTATADHCISTSYGSGVVVTPITPPGASSVMFEGWFQTTQTDRVLMSWSFNISGTTVPSVSLVIGSTGYPALVYDSGLVNFPVISSTILTGPAATNDGNWHHYVATVPVTDATGTWGLYVDGQEVAAVATIVAWTGGGTRAALIGGYWGAWGGPVYVADKLFGGSIDHVAYYSTPITADQIATHYQLGKAGFEEEDSGARAAVIMEGLAGVPSGLVNCDTGTVVLQGATGPLNTTTVASYLQQVANTERGIIYQDALGVIQFKNRGHVYTNAHSVNSQVTFTYDGSGEYYYSTGLVPQIDDTDLWNDVSVGRQGGVTQNASDATSITKFGRRSLTGYTSLLFAYDGDAADLAGGLLYQYKEPTARVRVIKASSLIHAASALPKILALNLLDRVTIVWKPLDGSSVQFDQQSLIEQVTHTITPGQWDTTLAVTPIGTENFANYGTDVYGTAIYGF